MKTIIRCIPILLLIFLLPGRSSAHDDYTKVIKKEFTVNPDAQLILDNKFGKIHCNNWDKNLVSAEIRITVTASSQSAAEKMLEQVDIVSNGSPAQVELRTVFMKDGGQNNSRITVDYIINMPSSLNLNLTNKFGDVFLNDLNGKGNLNISYGNLEVNKLMNSDNLIDLRFGKGDIRSITGAVLTMKYSELKTDYAGSLFVDSKYSDLNAKKIISLSMTFEGGDVEIETSEAVSGKSRFTDLNFGRIEKKFDLDIQYGDCDVEAMGQNFSLLSIKNKFANVNAVIPESTGYTLEADLKFCELDFPEDKTEFTQKISSNTSKTYRGVVGSKQNPEARVIVKSEYGSVSLE
jgi:hypothetical protein